MFERPDGADMGVGSRFGAVVRGITRIVFAPGAYCEAGYFLRLLGGMILFVALSLAAGNILARLIG
jgi:hypothetical protein